MELLFAEREAHTLRSMPIQPALVACPSCGCHARLRDAACPGCGAPLRADDGGVARTSVARLMSLTAMVGLATVGCGDSDGSGGGGGGSTTASGSTSTATGSTTAALTTVVTTVAAVSTYGVGPSGSTTASGFNGDDPGDFGAAPSSDARSTCEACLGAAMEGACDGEAAVYFADPRRAAWEGCVWGDAVDPGCPADDPTTGENEHDLCASDCDLSYVGMRSAYLGVVACGVCTACPTSCNAPAHCL